MVFSGAALFGREKLLAGARGVWRAPLDAAWPWWSLRMLARLRWFALAGQFLVVALLVLVWKAAPPLGPTAGIFAVLALTNLVLQRLKPRNPAPVLGVFVLLDVVLLTLLLALSGGPANPFTVLYLVHVMLAAVVTTRPWTWTVVVVSSVAFAALFSIHVPLPPELGGHWNHGMGDGYSVHLQGMWLAYCVAAVAIGLFASSTANALRLERERRDHASRLLGLAALAAGAAHEIGNPLGTIRVAAGELEAELHARQDATEMLEDARLIVEEVGRAKAVLDRMAAAAGELRGEAIVPIMPTEVLAKTMELLGAEAARVEVEVPQSVPAVRWPLEATRQALVQILRNALQAAPNRSIGLRLRSAGERIEVEVRDEGSGMQPAVLARVGEPFFTTREGGGIGLGIFVARSLVERMGGILRIESGVGRGTRVTLVLPQTVGGLVDGDDGWKRDKAYCW